jgi:hypothetical protein
MPPIRIVRKIVVSVKVVFVAITASTMRCRKPGACMRSYSAQPTSRDARPPKPLSSATISGIAVIFTQYAQESPIAVPATRPTTIQVKLTTS